MEFRFDESGGLRHVAHLHRLSLVLMRGRVAHVHTGHILLLLRRSEDGEENEYKKNGGAGHDGAFS